MIFTLVIDTETNTWWTELSGQWKSSPAPLPIHQEWLNQHLILMTEKRCFYTELGDEKATQDWIIWCVDQNNGYSYNRLDVENEKAWRESQRTYGKSLHFTTGGVSTKSKKIAAPANLSLDMLGLAPKKGA